MDATFVTGLTWGAGSRLLAWLTVCAGGLAAALPAAADTPDPPDTSGWICEFCPFPDGYRADYRTSVDYATDDSAYFGDATGYEREGAYLNFAGDGSYLSGRYQARWAIEDLGLDTRHVAVQGGRQGRYDYRFAYRELPRHRFDTTQTIFSPSGPGFLSLPSGWQRAPLTGGFPALGSALFERDIGSDRRSFDFGAAYLPYSALKLSATYKRIERSGVDIAAGSYFTQSSLLPQPLDYSTDDVALSAQLSGARGYLAAGYRGSFFQNKLLALSWESPFLTAAGAGTGRMAQSPDNRHQQLSLSGGYRIDAADTRISFNGAVGRLTQDDALLPYTSNNELTSALLPRRQLDGEIDKTNIALTLSASPLDKLRIDLRYRYDRSDNNTPVEEWNRVIADTFNSGEVEENLPYSFRRGKLSLGAAYRLSRTLRVAGGYDRTEHERDFQDVAEQTEDSSWGSVTWRPTAWLDLRAKGGAARRDVDRYDESVAESFGQNPLLGKYNLAYRYRRFAEVSVAASGIEKPVSLSVTSLYADDDYTKSPLGLLDGEDLRISGDLSYTLAENRHLYLQAGYEDIQSTQAGSERFSLPDWRADNSDSFRTVGAGLKLARLRNAVDVTMDYTRSAGNTEIALATAAGDADSLPDLASTLDSFRMRLSWRKTARMTLYLSARYERFVVDDWALQGVQADTVPVILTLGAEPYDYHRMLIGIGIRYRAGDPAPGAESP